MDKIQFKDTNPPRFYDVYFKEGKIARIHHYIGSPEKTMFDKYGKVTAVAAGTAKITVTASNGESAEIAIIVSAAQEEKPEEKPEQKPEENEPTETPEESKPEESKKGCGGSVVASVFGLVALTGAVVVMKKRKEQ